MMNMGSLRGLHRRLERVESRAISDTSRHVPLSQEWWTYWDERLDCLYRGATPQERVPLEYIDAVLARAGRRNAGGSSGDRRRAEDLRFGSDTF